MRNRNFTVHAYGRRLAESRILEICTCDSANSLFLGEKGLLETIIHNDYSLYTFEKKLG